MSSYMTFTTSIVTADQTLDDTAQIYFIDCLSNDVTVTLPTVVGNAGIYLRCKRIDMGTNVCTMAAADGENIENLASFQMYPFETYGLVVAGNTWQIVDWCAQ
jgi:hypothetical protein